MTNSAGLDQLASSLFAKAGHIQIQQNQTISVMHFGEENSVMHFGEENSKNVQQKSETMFKSVQFWHGSKGTNLSYCFINSENGVLITCCAA